MARIYRHVFLVLLVAIWLGQSASAAGSGASMVHTHAQSQALTAPTMAAEHDCGDDMAAADKVASKAHHVDMNVESPESDSCCTGTHSCSYGHCVPSAFAWLSSLHIEVTSASAKAAVISAAPVRGAASLYRPPIFS